MANGWVEEERETRDARRETRDARHETRGRVLISMDWWRAWVGWERGFFRLACVGGGGLGG